MGGRRDPTCSWHVLPRAGRVGTTKAALGYRRPSMLPCDTSQWNLETVTAQVFVPKPSSSPYDESNACACFDHLSCFPIGSRPMVCAHRAPLSLVSLLSVSLSYAPETLRPSRFLSLEHPPFHASCGWLCHRLRSSTASHLRLPDVCNQRGT